MKIVLNIIVVALIIFLGYLLYNSISEPIAFKNAYDKREGAVVEKLKEVREAQEYFKSIKGEYAGSFDSLKYVLNNDSFPVVKVYEDPENRDEFRFDTTKVAAKDSLQRAEWDVNLDSLSYVPYSDGDQFSIFADTLTYQKTLTNVVEVGVPYKEFMGKYADDRFKKYNDRYNPDKVLKFGSKSSPSISGNWE